MLETLLQPNDKAERCGLLLKDGRVIAVTNVADDTTQAYEMNPPEVLPFIDEIVATWHTHPEGPAALSGADYAGFTAWPDLEHYIVAPEAVVKYRVEDGAVIICD